MILIHNTFKRAIRGLTGSSSYVVVQCYSGKVLEALEERYYIYMDCANPIDPFLKRILKRIK